MKWLPYFRSNTGFLELQVVKGVRCELAVGKLAPPWDHPRARPAEPRVDAVGAGPLVGRQPEQAHLERAGRFDDRVHQRPADPGAASAGTPGEPANLPARAAVPGCAVDLHRANGDVVLARREQKSLAGCECGGS